MFPSSPAPKPDEGAQHFRVGDVCVAAVRVRLYEGMGICECGPVEAHWAAHRKADGSSTTTSSVGWIRAIASEAVSTGRRIAVYEVEAEIRILRILHGLQR